MGGRDNKAEDSQAEDNPGQDETEQPPDMSDEAKRRRRQRMFKALLEARGQLIVVPDDVIN
jgi:hypothetical protein